MAQAKPQVEPAPVDPPSRLGISACLMGHEVRFDGGHKLTVLSHSAEHYQKLGCLVAQGEGLPWKKTLIGFLKSTLGGADGKELLEEIEGYRRQEVPDWVQHQVYLNPYPRELILRNPI